jgi:acylphosphatase
MPEGRIELRVRGVVQGVGFRYAARRRARELGLSGYAENLDDGSVEIVAEGDERALEEMIAWSRGGPPAAEVTSVDVARGEARGGFSGFDVR